MMMMMMKMKITMMETTMTKAWFSCGPFLLLAFFVLD
jgi:hypothetical protein